MSRRSTPPPGLCGRCAWVRRVGNRRGSTFFMCGLSKEDPRFPRYPALPVFSCAGFEPEPGGGSGSERGRERSDAPPDSLDEDPAG